MREDIDSFVIEEFKTYFGVSPEVLAKAPGRLEIIGNHTDYNDGFVLSSATDFATCFAVRYVPGKTCKLYSADLDSEVVFDLDNLSELVPGDWSNYVKGMAVELGKLGAVSGFEGFIKSTVPLSAGMSSSAALEIASGMALKELFKVELTKEELAKAGQRVENQYVGVNTGLMDQFSSVFGKEGSLILSDFREDKVLKNVDIPRGYVFVVANSLVKHNLVESEYNIRRESCERALKALQKECPGSGYMALRDVTIDELLKAKNCMDHSDFFKALHIVGENTRVLEGVEALEAGNIKKFGELLFESHESSRVNFKNSCEELDYMVELAKSIPGCVGARLSGGGFGGISVHLVEESMAESYRERLSTAYKIRVGKNLETFVCGVGKGAQAISLDAVCVTG